MINKLTRTLAVLAVLASVCAFAVPASASAAQDESDPTLTHALTDSSVSAQINRLYWAYFDRGPDDSGYDHWFDRLTNQGGTLAEVSQSFSSSDEFIDTYGDLDNQGFVELVYVNVQGREGEAAGVEFWVKQLEDGINTRGEVMIGFSESPEYINRLRAEFDNTPVLRLYCAYFLREPLAAGLTFWTDRLANDTPIADISDQFANIEEFQDTYGDLENDEFVELIYNNVQGRDAEASGLAFWTGELDSNAWTRGGVMVFFSESDEYQARFNAADGCPAPYSPIDPVDPVDPVDPANTPIGDADSDDDENGKACHLFLNPPKNDIDNDGVVDADAMNFGFYLKSGSCFQEYEAWADGNDLIFDFVDVSIGGIDVTPVSNGPINHTTAIDNDDYPNGETENIFVTGTVNLLMDNGDGTTTLLVTNDFEANYRIYGDDVADQPDGSWQGINGEQSITYHVDPYND